MRRELMSKRGTEIRGMFGRIAGRYDLLNHLLSLGQDVLWRRALARRVAAAPPGPVLDVCTGTGDVALTLSDRRVVGCDFALPMLERARGKADRRRRFLPLAAGDAGLLPFADGVAAATTVAFGVRNFEDLDRGLAELVRVTRPGGTVLVLEFSPPRGPLAPVLGWWSRTVPPRVGSWISGDPEAYRYLPASIDEFPGPQEMVGRLSRAGLERARATGLTGGVATLYQGWRSDG